MSEINFAFPPALTGATSAAGGLTPHTLRVLTSLEGLLNPGQQLQAQVLARLETAQGQQLSLRLTLADGRSVTLDALTARQPELASGTRLQLTALSDNRLLIETPPGAARPLTRLDLPAGSLLQARVLSSTPAGNLQQIVAQLPDGRQLLLESARPLPVGSLLNARVLDDRSLQFIGPDARVQQLDLLQQLAGQFARQSPLSALFTALRALQGQPLPPPLQASVERLLNSQPSAAQLGDPRQLAAILRNAGIGLESHLATGQAGALDNDLKANLLRLLGQLSSFNPTTALQTPAGSLLLATLPTLARQVLGALGQRPERQPGLNFPLPSQRLEGLENPSLQLLLKLAAGAVARVQSHQLASLAQATTSAEGQPATVLQMEIPVRDLPTPVQLRLRGEDEPPGKRNAKQRARQWKIDLAFDMEPLGPLQVQAQLCRNQFSGQLWAERADTAELIGRELGELRRALGEAGLEIGELDCQRGTPPAAPAASLETNWIHVTA
ncbi:MAG TPA: flagellar hook-length control protein FliK [Pseudomonas sp.]|uniref:flagellar hook-length control protein FliK n=1 Tax=Pseudomonas sp. TaxID=306 RepID=UPI002B5FDFAD|nr:flagellar hook-length control protein FliK [Pseudomonas sp.]HTO19271.1 flagellar hook-length control protein FliK [Pseudomonas sp.]